MPGFADLHAHWMAHMAYGGHLLWGQPSGDISVALRSCDGVNHGGDFNILGYDLSAALIKGLTHQEFEDGLPVITSPHPSHGYPTFEGWPFSGTIIHQQMHVDWLRRAYDGGLRLLSMLAVNNRLLSWVMEAREEAFDDDQIRQQLEAARELVSANSDWMEIATSAEHAASILADDRLVVVLGVEVDEVELLISRDPAVLGTLEAQAASYLSGASDSAPQIAGLAATLQDLGVRQITPIHLADNIFGGPALYMDLTASNSHFLNLWMRGEAWSNDSGWPELSSSPPADIEFKLSAFQVPPNRKTFFLDAPVDDAVRIAAYADRGLPAHANARGLTQAGQVLLLELWRRGILVDIDHMSAHAVETALALAERFEVPMIATHCSMRAVAPSRSQLAVPVDWWLGWDGRTPDTRTNPLSWPTLAHEGMRSDDELLRLYGLGGMVGVAARQPSTLSGPTSWFGRPLQWFDAGTIPAGWTQYLHAVSRVGTEAAVALGTDINGMNRAPKPVPPPVLTPTLDWDIYQPRQPGGIEPQTTGSRTWRVENDGLAHYGMLPDLLQRWRMEGVTQQDLAPLWRSADGYVATWRRAEQAASRVTRP